MIGKAYVASCKYYDMHTRSMSFKHRPALIIGKADDSDYIILPISRVTNRQNLNRYYDITLNPSVVPSLNLRQTSYVRTHKQTVVHAADLGHKAGILGNSITEM